MKGQTQQRRSTGDSGDEVQFSLPVNFKRATNPIPAPGHTRSTGLYGQALRVVLKDETTTLETGMSPRREWHCQTFTELKKVHGGLMAARRRMLSSGHKEYSRIGLIRQTNHEEKKYVVYLWHIA